MIVSKTVLADGDGRFFTFDPHRVPFSGAGEPHFEASAQEIHASDVGESTQIDAIELPSQSEFASL